MDMLAQNLRFLCDESRMLSGMAVAYGTPTQSETARYGRAQEVALDEAGRFVPCVRPLEANALCDLASLTKLFTAVLTILVTATSPGEPSLRQKDCRFRDRELAAAKSAHQNTYS